MFQKWEIAFGRCNPKTGPHGLEYRNGTRGGEQIGHRVGHNPKMGMCFVKSQNTTLKQVGGINTHQSS